MKLIPVFAIVLTLLATGCATAYRSSQAPTPLFTSQGESQGTLNLSLAAFHGTFAISPLYKFSVAGSG